MNATHCIFVITAIVKMILLGWDAHKRQGIETEVHIIESVSANGTRTKDLCPVLTLTATQPSTGWPRHEQRASNEPMTCTRFHFKNGQIVDQEVITHRSMTIVMP